LREIVGVVGDTKQFGRDDDAMKQVYEPFLQNPWSAMTLTIRTSDDPLSLANAVRGQVLAIDKDQPIANVQSMEDIVSRSVGDRRFSLLLFGIFAGIALLLAGIGTYGVVAYSVVQRRHEIGIRLALGAQRTDVLTLVVRQVGALAGIGIALGLAGSLALTRALNSQLYKVSSTDLTTFASVTILVITLAALASIFPAYHASRVDPTVALRYE
jgi:ABC-type antimicrobial peptide transport system permease subunit